MHAPATLLCLLISVFATGQSRVLDCPGGVRSGQSKTRGMYTYKCQNGFLDKQGCMDKLNGREYPIGQSWVDENNYQITCKVEEGYLRHVVTGCAANGQVYQAGESWTLGRSDDKFVYTCEDRDYYLAVEITGCILDGRRININEEAPSRGILYGCQTKESGATGLCAVGCIDSQGGRHYIGQKWSDDKHDYLCSTEGKRCHTAVTACRQNGRSYGNGEQWTIGDITYRCDIDPYGDDADITQVP